MDTTEIGFWLLVARLRAAGRSLGQDTLISYAELKLPYVAAAYNELVPALAAAGLLAGDAAAFTLTARGEDRCAQVCASYSLHAAFYNIYYRAAAASPAHTEFCRRVYGLDLGQHGMADMPQIHAALDALHVTIDSSLLDFGCGDGRISEYIAGRTGARVSGIDIASESIAQARERTRECSRPLHFYTGDLSTGAGEVPPGPFDAILAIDSFFFAPDQPGLLMRLLALLRPGGRLAIFYICPPETAPQDTALGRALCERGVPYRVLDFTAANAAHWRLKRQVLAELRAPFEAEGQQFLYRNRMAECEGSPENFGRYLYLIQPRGERGT